MNFTLFKHRITIVFYWVGWVLSFDRDKTFWAVTYPFGSLLVENALAERLTDAITEQHHLVESYKDIEAAIANQRWGCKEDYDELMYDRFMMEQDLNRVNTIIKELQS